MTIVYHGTVNVPKAVVDAAEPIKMLNYKTTTPAKFRKNTLTEDIAADLMRELAQRISIDQNDLDYVYFSAAHGAEPHTDILPPEKFTSTTFVVPVILPPGRNIIEAQGVELEVHVGGIYEFDHEKTHSMTVADTESGCVVIMVAVKH